MSEDLKKLYQAVLMERQKSTLGFQKREDAQHIIEAYNPVCGDQFQIYLDIENGFLQKVSYHGYGCAVSKASSSLLVESLSAKSLVDCRSQLQYFYQCMDGKETQPPEIYEALAMSKNFPGRQQCATLSWDAIQEFLLNEKGT